MNEKKKPPKRNSCPFLLLLLLPWLAFAQPEQELQRILFYNVENFFDTDDDSRTDDEEFLPSGLRLWTWERYQQKQNRIAQVILAAGEGKLPLVIGLCEVENRRVLDGLLEHTPLKDQGYSIVHKESPDRRGIDVALLYRREGFRPLTYRAIPLVHPADTSFRTRDILYLKGILLGDTLHLFVNHWPSKYGGERPTQALRALAATVLRHHTDSLYSQNPQSRILIMGDFNDSPFEKSVSEVLGAGSPADKRIKTKLVNLALPLAEKGKGSLKYRGRWELIDQMIVSTSLLDSSGVHVAKGSFRIFSPAFLLEKDETHLGVRPKRTYLGYRYHGGFSDHLPVGVDLLPGITDD